MRLSRICLSFAVSFVRLASTCIYINKRSRDANRWNRLNALVTRVKLERIFYGKREHFRLLNSVMRYRESPLRHHRLVKKKKVTFEQLHVKEKR